MSTQVDGLRRFVGSRPRDGWRPSDVPVVVVVGTAGGVGTSTVAALLAAATAQTGRRTLLVDCDEMVGALHRIHNVGIRHGIAALLDPNVAVNDVAVEISSGCTLLPGGEPPSARRVPFDPTARRTVLRRIAQAYPAYDAVVIDARSQLDGMLAAAEAGVRRFLVVGGCSPAGIAASYAVLKTAESRWPGITVDVVFNRHNADVAKASFDRIHHGAQHFLNRSLGFAGTIPNDAEITAAPDQPFHRCASTTELAMQQLAAALFPEVPDAVRV